VSEDNNQLLLEAILRNSAAGVLAYEAIRNTAGGSDDFRFILINPAAERLSGLTAATDVGRRLLELDPATRNNGLFERFVSIVESGEPLEFGHYSPTPQPRWYRISGLRLGDGLTVSYLDISKLKQHEKTMRLNEERFRQILDGVEDYASGRYHEEGWRVRKDGSQFLADVVPTAVRDRNGALRGFAKATRDITAARTRDKALQEQVLILDLAPRDGRPDARQETRGQRQDPAHPRARTDSLGNSGQ
jgi:PAS domain-containing protein